MPESIKSVRWRVIKGLRMITLLIIVLAVLIVTGGGVLSCYQSKLIYHPSPYTDNLDAYLKKNQRVSKLPYQTSQGNQVAFYVAPSGSSKAAPKQIWMMFHGNGAHALDWIEIISDANPNIGWLLIDYPGYGFCEGNPNPQTIQESAHKAVETLAEKLDIPFDKLTYNLNITGFSLGTAAALLAANDLQVRGDILLLAPFTSMLDMAKRTVGSFGYLVQDRYDNAQILEHLQTMDPNLKIVILHGSNDVTIPVSMSRKMVEDSKNWIQYYEINGAGHNLFANTEARSIVLSTLNKEKISRNY